MPLGLEDATQVGGCISQASDCVCLCVYALACVCTLALYFVSNDWIPCIPNYFW